MNIDYVVLAEFGSTVYGTTVPTSDRDFKGIYIPSVTDILLGRAKKSIQLNTKVDKTAKNSENDVDQEVFSLQEYFHLLCEGQTGALDLLFTPDKHILQTSEAWDAIRKNKKAFLTKGVSSFIGYARQQAGKYGLKGSRVAAVRLALDFLKTLEPHSKLTEHWSEIKIQFQGREFFDFPILKGPNGQPTEHLEVCNRKIPIYATVKYASQVYQKIFDEYGHRALLAEKNEGVDWKALLHALRVQEEAYELLTTGSITFPRPERELLLKIRKGELPYKEVATMIEEGIGRLEDAMAKSNLREKPDYNLADALIKKYYLRKILRRKNESP